jgi:hypothetical protein
MDDGSTIQRTILEEKTTSHLRSDKERDNASCGGCSEKGEP